MIHRDLILPVPVLLIDRSGRSITKFKPHFTKFWLPERGSAMQLISRECSIDGAATST